jgi:hypothetical protein
VENWVRIRMRIDIKMESRIRMVIKTMPTRNTAYQNRYFVKDENLIKFTSYQKMSVTAVPLVLVELPRI